MHPQYVCSGIYVPTIWYVCMCMKYYAASSLAVVQLRFDSQNYTVTEGGAVNVTLEAVPPSEGYDFEFTVTLQYMNGSATGECAFTAVTVKDQSSLTSPLHLSGHFPFSLNSWL